jgi:PAS domain-containing protein
MSNPLGMTVEGRAASSVVALSAAEAAEVLGLPADVVATLGAAGYLPSVAPGRFTVDAVESFRSAAAPLDDEALDPGSLLVALHLRSRAMAEHTLELLATVYPLAAEFNDAQREIFIAEAVERIEAIIALCARGPDSHEALELDMADVGEAAAHAGVPLPAVLIALRITRDLVVQTAIETAESRGRNWGVALSVTLTRVLPAIDRLSDAVALGYREAMLEIEAEGLDRYRNLVEQLSEGVFGLDADGCVQYANPALCAALGRPLDALVGRSLEDVLGVAPGTPPTELSVDGSSVRVQQVERLRDGIVAGWDGVVHRPAP